MKKVIILTGLMLVGHGAAAQCSPDGADCSSFKTAFLDILCSNLAVPTSYQGLLVDAKAGAATATADQTVPRCQPTLSPSPAVSALGPGDIAITGLNTDNPDVFRFVALVNIALGTKIHFTDNGWKLPENEFRDNEGTVTWTAADEVPIGTEIEIEDTGSNTYSASSGSAVESNAGFALSGSGDQLLAYQGADAAPVFLAALNNNDPGWDATAGSTSTSALPTGLADGIDAVAVSEADNTIYDCSTYTGTAGDIRAAVNNADNWIDSSSPVLPAAPFCSFAIGSLGGALLPGDIAIIGYQSDGGDGEIRFVTLYDMPATSIQFTDRGWLSSNVFRSGEGTLTWTSDAAFIPAGTVVDLIHDSGNTWIASTGSVTESDAGFSLSTAGDQIIAFQGSIDSSGALDGTIVAALNYDSPDGWDTGTSLSANESALPLGLADNDTAASFTHKDNGFYDCSAAAISGTADDLRAAMADASNWTRDNTVFGATPDCSTISVELEASVCIDELVSLIEDAVGN